MAEDVDEEGPTKANGAEGLKKKVKGAPSGQYREDVQKLLARVKGHTKKNAVT